MPTRPEPALGESALVGEDGGQQLLQVLVAYSRLRRAKNARQQVLESIVSRHLAGPFASGSGLSPRNRMIEEGTRASLRLGAARHYVRVRRGPGTPRMGDGMGHICGTPNTRPCGMRITAHRTPIPTSDGFGNCSGDAPKRTASGRGEASWAKQSATYGSARNRTPRRRRLRKLARLRTGGRLRSADARHICHSLVSRPTHRSAWLTEPRNSLNSGIVGPARELASA